MMSSRHMPSMGQVSITTPGEQGDTIIVAKVPGAVSAPRLDSYWLPSWMKITLRKRNWVLGLTCSHTLSFVQEA